VIFIIVTKRSHDWHACIQDHPGKWKCGKSPEDAVRKLMAHHLIHEAGVCLNPPLAEIEGQQKAWRAS